MARLQRKYVCSECFADPALREYVGRHATGKKCAFCGADASGVELEEIVAHIRLCLTLAYEWQSGRLRSSTQRFDTAELLRDKVRLDLPRDAEGRLFRSICRGIGKGLWHEKERTMRLTYAWNDFREIFLWKRRFFLDAILKDSDHTSAEGFFQEIADTAKRRGLCVDLDKGTPLYRVRWQESAGRLRNPEQLGPPLPHQAVQANRMNPPGIPYFYASDSERTALAEIGKSPGCYALARFETERPCRIVDLQRVREAPSIFVEMEEWDYQTFKENQDLSVLRWFAHAIAQPVPRDTQPHVEYVPTQVLAEFFRTYEFFEPPLEGIRFLSAQDPGGSNLVLFAGQEAIHGTALNRQPGNSRRPWLSLVEVKDVVIKP